MSKLISLAIGLLTVIAIAPKSEATVVNSSPISLQQPAENLHAQIIFKVGDRDRRDYYRRERERRREEIRREREAERRQYRNRNRRERERERDREYRRNR
jgi:hypothetical protein